MKVSTDDAGQVTVELNEAERKRGLQPCDWYKLSHPTPDAVEELRLVIVRSMKLINAGTWKPTAEELALFD